MPVEFFYSTIWIEFLDDKKYTNRIELLPKFSTFSPDKHCNRTRHMYQKIRNRF